MIFLTPLILSVIRSQTFPDIIQRIFLQIPFRILPRNLLTSTIFSSYHMINPLKPNDPYSGCTAPLTSKRCILYIYSTNIGIEYFKHGKYSPFFFSLQNAVCFIILTYLAPVLFTFYIQSVLKFKKIIPALKS